MYLHQTMYAPERSTPPSLEEMGQWTKGQVSMRLGYSIAVPDRDTRPTRPENYKRFDLKSRSASVAVGPNGSPSPDPAGYVPPPATEAPANAQMA